MGLFGNLNKGSVDWGIDTKELNYIKLAEFPVNDDVIPVKGVFINSKGNFDPHPVAIIDSALVDLPAHMTESVKTILETPEMVEAIKAGKCGFKVRSYEASKFGKKDCRSIEWVDII